MRTLLVVLVCCLPLCAQDFSDYEIVLVADGYTFTEGPAWSREGYLLFSDVPNMNIWKLTPGVGQPELFRDSSNRANGNAFDSRGRLYTCETGSRRVTRTDRKGRVTVLLDKWEGKPLNATNDIVVRRDGHTYFTDPAFGSREDTRELDFYGVYHIDPKGNAELIAKPKGRPNGIGLSPDGRTLYVANTDERRLYAYDLDRRGTASGERVLIEGIDGPPDGLAVDEKGNIYVTANQLPVYSPQGKLLHTIAFGERPANCTFGGEDLSLLYVTARTSLYVVRQLGVKELCSISRDSRRYPRRPILGVGAVILDCDAVLLVERGREPLKGYWSLPGGVMEVGELVEDAVRREVLEETGLKVHPGGLVQIFERIMRDDEGRPEYHYVLLDYCCEVTGGALQAGDDVSRAEWVLRQDLEKYQLTEGALPVIHQAFEMRSQGS